MAPSDVDNPSGLTFDKYGRILIGNIMSYSNTVYTKTSDAAERYPTQINEIWNNYAAIPFTRPALVANAGPGAGVVELVHMRLQRVGLQTATRLLYEQDPADLAPPANPNSANSGLSAVVPAWTGDPLGAAGQYAPTLTTTILVPALPPAKDGVGSSASRPLGSAPGPNTQTTSVTVTIPYDSHTWVVDGTSHLLEFPRDAPPVVKAGDWWVNLDSYGAVLYLDFYRYTGATGGNGAPTGGGTVIGGQSLGTLGSSPIFNQNAGGVLTFNALKGSSGIQVSAPDVNGDITVSSTVAPIDIAGTVAGGVQLWATPNVGGNIPFRQLRAGAGITLDTTTSPGSITINAAGSVQPVSTGGGTPVYNGVNGAGAPQIRSLLSGAGITVAPSSGSDAVQVSSSVSAVRIPGSTSLVTGTRAQLWMSADTNGNIPLFDLEVGPGLYLTTGAGSLIINMNSPTNTPGGITLSALTSIGGPGTATDVYPTTVADIYTNMTGTIANIRSIVSGSGINVSVVDSSGALADRIMISSTVAPTSATGAPTITPASVVNPFQTAQLYAPTPANTVTLYSIAAGSGMSLTATSNGQIVLNAAVIGAASQATTGADTPLPSNPLLPIYRSNASGTLQFASLVAGSNVTITASGGGAFYTIAATGGGGVGASLAEDSVIQQPMIGINTYKLWNNNAVSGKIALQSIQAGSNITITTNTNGVLTIASQAGGSGNAVPVVTSSLPSLAPAITGPVGAQTVPLTGTTGVAGEAAIYSLTTAGGVTLATGVVTGSIYISATTVPVAATSTEVGTSPFNIWGSLPVAAGTIPLYRLAAGANITITPGMGVLTITATGGGGGITTTAEDSAVTQPVIGTNAYRIWDNPIAGKIGLQTLQAGTGVQIDPSTGGILKINNNMILTNKAANSAGATEGQLGQVFNLITQTSAGANMQSIPIQAGAGISFDTTTGNSVIITAGAVTTTANASGVVQSLGSSNEFKLWDNTTPGSISLQAIKAGTGMQIVASTGLLTVNNNMQVNVSADGGTAIPAVTQISLISQPGGAGDHIYSALLKSGTGISLVPSYDTFGSGTLMTVTVNSTFAESPFTYLTTGGTQRMITSAVPSNTNYNSAHYVFGLPSLSASASTETVKTVNPGLITQKMMYRTDKGAFRVGAVGYADAYATILDLSDTSVQGVQWNNVNSGYYSFAGGFCNAAVALASTCFGVSNAVYSGNSGIDNTMLTGVPVASGGSSILGGSLNFINSALQNCLSQASVIVSGYNNVIEPTLTPAGATKIVSNYHFIGSGSNNKIIPATADAGTQDSISYNSIVGGNSNTIKERTTSSAILGGSNNTVGGNTSGSAIIAGDNNAIDFGVATVPPVNCTSSAIIAGTSNKLNGSQYSAILTGVGNIITDAYKSAILAGDQHVITGGVGNVVVTGTTNSIKSNPATLVDDVSYCVILNGTNNEFNAVNGISSSSAVISSMYVKSDKVNGCTIISTGNSGADTVIKGANGCVIMANYEGTVNKIIGDGTYAITNNAIITSTGCIIDASATAPGKAVSASYNTILSSTGVGFKISPATTTNAGVVDRNILLGCSTVELNTNRFDANTASSVYGNIVAGSNHFLQSKVTATNNSTNVFNNIVLGNNCVLTADPTTFGITETDRGIYNNFIFGGSQGINIANRVGTNPDSTSNMFIVSVTNVSKQPTLVSMFAPASANGNTHPVNGAAFFVGDGDFRIYKNDVNTTFARCDASSWSFTCDRNAKENIIDVDCASILDQLDSVPVYRYNYIGLDPSEVNIGPMAQDWNPQFAADKNSLMIRSNELDGVALASIKGLHAKVKAQAATIEGLLARLAALEAKVA